MARPITANDIALYMLKTAVKARCVELKLDHFPEISLDTLRTRIYVAKRNNPNYEIFRVAMGADFITIVNVGGDDDHVVVTKRDVEESIPVRVAGQATKQPITEAGLSWPISTTTPQIVAAIKTLIEVGVIPTFTITGCNSLIFNKEFPNSGFVIKDSPRGVSLF